MHTERLLNGTQVYMDENCRFGQDSLLLAHFCRVHGAQAACDLGTGCGILPLHWHDRGHRGPCLALEREPAALALLRTAIAAGDIGHIVPVCKDLRDSAALRPYAQHCDVVACNPPYFTGGPVSPNAARAAARHELTCTVADVCAAARLLLKDGGRLCLCQRPERLADVLSAMRTAGIEPKRLQFVAARPQKAPWLFLVEGQKNRAPGLRVLPLLVTAAPDGRPSAAMRAIYGPPGQKSDLTEEDAP